MNEATRDTQIARNLHRIQERMTAAWHRSGYSVEPRLIAVTKYAPLPCLESLYRLGIHSFGESRPQQLRERATHFENLFTRPPIGWHLIGQLQRNKIRQVLPWSNCIHSVDSLRLLEAIDRVAVEFELQPRLLLQVNISGEQSKSGFTTTGLQEALPALVTCQQVKIEGLMTMAPETDQTEVIRGVFRELRELRDHFQKQLPDTICLRELSMGMSGDFEIAIEEGATMVRIGSSLFENAT